jgi:hypothetical protein
VSVCIYIAIIYLLFYNELNKLCLSFESVHRTYILKILRVYTEHMKGLQLAYGLGGLPTSLQKGCTKGMHVAEKVSMI